MRLLQKLGAGIAGVGLLLFLIGGVVVHRGPDGIWFQVNAVHAVGGVAIFCGTFLSIVVAFSGRGTSRAK